MNPQGEQYAAQLAELNRAISAVISSCSDQQWQQTTASEGWTVGVVAHHVAVTQQAFVGIVGKLAQGETFSPDPSMDRVHDGNAQHARDHANATKEETLELLQRSQQAMVAQLRALSDDDLARYAGTFGPNDLTIRQVVEMIVLGHCRQHLASLRETLGA